jgi:hypothetical protein
MTDRPNWKPTLAAIALTLLWISFWYWGTLEAMAQIGGVQKPTLMGSSCRLLCFGLSGVTGSG